MDSNRSSSKDKSNPFQKKFLKPALASKTSIEEDEDFKINDFVPVEKEVESKQEPFTPVFSARNMINEHYSSAGDVTFHKTGNHDKKEPAFGEWKRVVQSAPEITGSNEKNSSSQQSTLSSLGTFSDLGKTEDKSSVSDQTESKTGGKSTKSGKTEILELLEYSRKNQQRKDNEPQIGIFGTFKISELRKFLDRN